ncbi:polysaccharide biosynthesis/export family protein [Iodidimonas sp. SYSU 1G8]|uniref:polysaccharide biosynthesis/export family protein n=1 Tax=Iodidimonas sp. SYSU 1G8 TaxID=3133967 RepID=UPI0031FF3CE2
MDSFDTASIAQPAPSTRYALVDVDEAVCGALAVRPEVSLRESFHAASPAPVPTVAVGDVLAVTMWEAGPGGLFSTPAMTLGGEAQIGARSAVLPDQTVAPDGTISVPYAGRLKVTGLQPAQIEQAIIAALKDRAVQPQAMVAVRSSSANSVTVAGDAVGGARLTLAVGGDRVLDVIAQAGGLRVAAHDVFVRLTRGGETASMSYNALLAQPEENVFLRGGDILTVIRNPQTFTALGATGANGVVAFDGDRLSLEEAVGKVGGLQDQRANPSAVFLFRFERAETLRSIAPGKIAPAADGAVPVIYRLDLKNPASYFCARQFAVADKDIVYVANAQLNELQKFLNIIGSVLAPVATGVTLSR